MFMFFILLPNADSTFLFEQETDAETSKINSCYEARNIHSLKAQQQYLLPNNQIGTLTTNLHPKLQEIGFLQASVIAAGFKQSTLVHIPTDLTMSPNLHAHKHHIHNHSSKLYTKSSSH